MVCTGATERRDDHKLNGACGAGLPPIMGTSLGYASGKSSPSDKDTSDTLSTCSAVDLGDESQLPASKDLFGTPLRQQYTSSAGGAGPAVSDLSSQEEITTKLAPALQVRQLDVEPCDSSSENIVDISISGMALSPARGLAEPHGASAAVATSHHKSNKGSSAGSSEASLCLLPGPLQQHQLAMDASPTVVRVAASPNISSTSTCAISVQSCASVLAPASAPATQLDMGISSARIMHGIPTANTNTDGGSAPGSPCSGSASANVWASPAATVGESVDTPVGVDNTTGMYRLVLERCLLA